MPILEGITPARISFEAAPRRTRIVVKVHAKENTEFWEVTSQGCWTGERVARPGPIHLIQVEITGSGVNTCKCRFACTNRIFAGLSSVVGTPTFMPCLSPHPTPLQTVSLEKAVAQIFLPKNPHGPIHGLMLRWCSRSQSNCAPEDILFARQVLTLNTLFR